MPAVVRGFILFLAIVMNAGAAGKEFKLSRYIFDIPERGEVPGYSLRFGTNQFSFLPPVGWSVRVEKEQQIIVLQRQDLSATMIMHIAEIPAPPFIESTEAELKTQAQSRIPGAVLVRKFRCFAGDGPGHAFDFTSETPQRVRVGVRVAFVKLQRALVDIQLTAASGDLEPVHGEFSTFLASLRTETGDNAPWNSPPWLR